MAYACKMQWHMPRHQVDIVTLRNLAHYGTLDAMNSELLMTPEDAAKLLLISEHTLAYWRRPKIDSDLPWIEVGGQVRYRLSDIQRWLDSRTRTGRSTA